MSVTFVIYALGVTVKQIIVGSLLGASAIAVLLHRLPKADVSVALKPVLKQEPPGTPSHVHNHPRKQAPEERLSWNKLG